MECKSNCAASVNINTPEYKVGIVGLCVYCPIVLLSIREEMLDICSMMGVFIVTYENFSVHSQDDCQDPDTPPKRDVQSPRGDYPGSLVSGGELLRPPGPDPGQVRDVAPGREGRHVHQFRCRQFWLFAACFLQSPTGFYSRRDGGPYSPTPRPQRRAQGDEGNRVVCRTSSVPGTVDWNAGASAADSKGICRAGASQNRGAGAGGREKKRDKA